MNQRSILPIACALALALGAVAFAQDLTPPPAGASIVLQPAKMVEGEERTYKIETTIASELPDGEAPGRSGRVFRIEVLRAGTNGLLLAYTQFSAEGGNFPQLASALNGRQIQFEATPAGYPTKVTNWGAQRADIMNALQANGGESLIDAVRDLSEEGVITNILSDVVLLAAVQSMAPMASARVDAPLATPAEGVKVKAWTVFEGSRGADCSFAVRRVTELDPASPYAVESKSSERLETFAFNSMADGWVVSLEESERRSRGGLKEQVIRKVARQGPKLASCELRVTPPKAK